MGTYKRYKNRVEMFLASQKGRRILNFCYSWGASVIILGVMLKIIHFPYATTIISVAMTFEAFVFFIFGFERPTMEYNWEEVFPVLKSKNPLDRPDFEQSKGTDSGLYAAVEGGNSVRAGKEMHAAVAGAGFVGESPQTIVNEGDAESMSESIHRLNDAASQIAKMADLTEATQTYLEQLNENIKGLNALYELQLKGASSQMENMEHINSGLSHIRGMYDGAVTDSSLFRAENERMAHLLGQLNHVYGRLLQAMTINMPNVPNPYYQPQQPPNPYQAPNNPPAGEGNKTTE